MRDDELRQLFKRERFEISFVAHATQINGAKLREFVGGADGAITDVERKAITNFLVPTEAAQRQNVATNSAIIEGMRHTLQQYGVAFIRQDKSDRLELASGTLVKIGGVIFVATAGHVIHQTTMLQFVGNNTAFFTCDFNSTEGFHNVRGGSNVEVLGGAKHARFDVGFLRLGNGAAVELGREPLELAKISTCTPQYGRNAFVFGYPSQFVKVRPRSQSSKNMPIGSITYPQPVLAPDEWPDTPSDSPTPDANVDCFVRYSVSDEMIKLVSAAGPGSAPPADLPKNLPDAEGLSGGGFWQTWESSDAMWNPSGYQLIAIQSSWLKTGEYLRAIQARHWLDLVRNECPDLRSLIDEHLATGIAPK